MKKRFARALSLLLIAALALGLGGCGKDETPIPAAVESTPEPTPEPTPVPDPLRDWWNGGYYGWWIVRAATGEYADLEDE